MLCLTAVSGFGLMSCAETQLFETKKSPKEILSQSIPEGSCELPWGGFINDGEEVESFSEMQLPCEQSCVEHRQIRRCENGELSGDPQFRFSICAEVGCPGCEFSTVDAQNVSIQHGEKVAFYQTNGNTLSCSESCDDLKTEGVCNRGVIKSNQTLDWNVLYLSCQYEECPCELPFEGDGPQEECGDSRFCEHGTSLLFYKAMDLTCANCSDPDQSLERTCLHGKWVNDDKAANYQRQFLFRTCSDGAGYPENCASCPHPDPLFSGSAFEHNEIALLSNDRYPACLHPDLCPTGGCDNARRSRLCNNGVLQITGNNEEDLTSYIYGSCTCLVGESCPESPPPELPPPPPTGLSFILGGGEEGGGGDGGGGDGVACPIPNTGCPNGPDCILVNDGEILIRYLASSFSCSQTLADITVVITCEPYANPPGAKARIQSTNQEIPFPQNFLDWIIPGGSPPQQEQCQCTTPWDGPAVEPGTVIWAHNTDRVQACLGEICRSSDFGAQFRCVHEEDPPFIGFVPVADGPAWDPEVWQYGDGQCQPVDCFCSWQGTDYPLDPNFVLERYKASSGTCTNSCQEAHRGNFICQIHNSSVVFYDSEIDVILEPGSPYTHSQCTESSNCFCDLPWENPPGTPDRINYLTDPRASQFYAYPIQEGTCFQSCEDARASFQCSLSGEDSVAITPHPDGDGTAWNPQVFQYADCGPGPCECVAWEGTANEQRVSEGNQLLAHSKSMATCGRTCAELRLSFTCQQNVDLNLMELIHIPTQTLFNDQDWFFDCGAAQGCECEPWPENFRPMGAFESYPIGAVGNCIQSCAAQEVPHYCVVDPNDENQVVINNSPGVYTGYQWNSSLWQPACTTEGCECKAWGAGTPYTEVVRGLGGILTVNSQSSGNCEDTCQGSSIDYTCSLIGDPGNQQVAFVDDVGNILNEQQMHPECQQNGQCYCDPFADGNSNFVRFVGGSFEVYNESTGDCFALCEDKKEEFYCIVNPSDPLSVVISDQENFNASFTWEPANFFKTCTNTDCICQTPWGNEEEGSFFAYPQAAGSCNRPCPTNRVQFECTQQNGSMQILPQALWNNGVDPDGASWKGVCNQSSACNCTMPDGSPTPSIPAGQEFRNFWAYELTTPPCDGQSSCSFYRSLFQCRYTTDGTEIFHSAGADILDYPHLSCQPNNNCSCSLPWGQLVSIGATGWAYSIPQVDCGFVCQDPNFGRPYQCQADGASAVLWDTHAGEPLDTSTYSLSSCVSKTDCAGQGGGALGGDGDGQGLGSYGDPDPSGGGGGGGPAAKICLDVGSPPPGDHPARLAVEFSKDRCQLPPAFSVPHDGIPAIFNIGGTIAPGVRVSAFTKSWVCPGEGSCEERRLSLYCDYDGRLYSPELQPGENIFPSCQRITVDHPEFEVLCP